MRLWHEDLIPYLPAHQLLGQHRECCALRGKGWGKKHKTVDYVFEHDPSYLVAFHYLVMDEMTKRGYGVYDLWWNDYYRGKILGMSNDPDWVDVNRISKLYNDSTIDGIHIYPEHDIKYFMECLDNLRKKGVILDLR